MAKPMEIFDGLALIYRYIENKEYKEDNFQVHNGQIFCCDYNGDEMDDYELKQMERAGWFEDEGAWSHNI